MYFFPRMTGIALILGFQILSETGQGIRHMWVTVSLRVRVHVRVVSLVTAGLLETSSPRSWAFHTTSRVAPGRRQRGVGLTRVLLPEPWRWNVPSTTYCVIYSRASQFCAQDHLGTLWTGRFSVHLSGLGPESFHSNELQVIPLLDWVPGSQITLLTLGPHPGPGVQRGRVNALSPQGHWAGPWFYPTRFASSIPLYTCMSYLTSL